MAGEVILVDCDEVCADFVGSALALAAKCYNVFATREDVTDEKIEVSLGCPHLPRDIEEEVIHREFVYRMKPIAEGIEFLRTLESLYGDDRVFINTAPWYGDVRQRATGHWAQQRYDWLRDYAGVGSKRVILANAKFLVAPDCVLVDDSISKLEGRKKAFCLARPHNTSYSGPRGNYAQALEWIRENVK
jgi:5'(3')-deoxyribonucleotidase